MRFLISIKQAAQWLTFAVLFGTSILSQAYPVRGDIVWALTATGNLVSCANGAMCYPTQSEIPATTPKVIRFSTQYQGSTLNLTGANGYVYIANHGSGTVTYSTTITDTVTGMVLASGVTTTGYIVGTTTCAQKGLTPQTSAQPLLITTVPGVQLLKGHNIEMAISITATQPVNLGLCVGMSGSSFTTSTLSLSGFIVPTFDSPTPTCGSTLNADTSGTFAFTVSGSHSNTANWVTLDATGIPVGATLTPSVPISGNPASTVFSWKPPSNQIQNVDATFSVSDGGGNNAICKIHLNSGNGNSPPGPKQSILVSPREFPQKVTFETICRESVAGVCLNRDIVEICVGGKCFGVPQREPAPCKICEFEKLPKINR